ncbi:topoisomerase [Pseudoflavonifractor sp. An44]|uniref:DUF3991 and TOPRIM domain-containing protein n=1 Tax=Pseudoflavonifractor sp. An44 TaxID=1965635 RepID=UPI000B38B88F|nr:DUF3991 and TOPRIM domain-containing protein [Pseudoflavonifractor sp. An44]OUN99703.1 topoisomerase [Pseudoflavonifractor sp. An44]
MAYFTAEEIARAREVDLLSYLQSCEPHQLVRLSGGTYCTREHDSLKISNGKWHWFSRGVGGKTALDYLIKVQGYTFIQAMEAVQGQRARNDPAPVCAQQKQERKLLLPPANETSLCVQRYLKGRGIHSVVIRHCLENGSLYESKPYHSAVFVGRDRSGVPRYAAIRGTSGAYKGEATGSDKRFSFSLAECPDSTRVHVFESAIDAMSHATLELLKGRPWQEDALLSLAGVFVTKREKVVPVALEQFLKDHPNIRSLHLHLDNDQVGRGAVKGIMEGLQDQYEIYDEPPARGKDVNEMLMLRVGLIKGKGTLQR